nr:hypothetical protein [Tanacetum cinerariifolium]
MKTDLLSNPSEIDALKLIKKLADIYCRRVTQMAKSSFSLSTRHIALWKSQMEDHTSEWLRMVLISSLGQTMNDIYGDHVVSCAGIIGIKHQHNIVRDTLVDICLWFGILVGKEVDIGLGGRELDKDAVTLLKRIQRFSVTQDIEARIVVYIFNMIGFAIARRVGTQIVSWLLTNFL